MLVAQLAHFKISSQAWFLCLKSWKIGVDSLKFDKQNKTEIKSVHGGLLSQEVNSFKISKKIFIRSLINRINEILKFI